MATVNTPAVLRGGKAAERAARDALASLSANLPPAPDSFEHGAQYRVRLTRSVPAGAGGHWLRPSDDVVVSGEFAETIRDAITGAQKIG
jgi:hypothetical protein